MSTIGIIGSGQIGSTVAKLAVDAGYDVVVSNSRGPETLTDIVDELGPRATAGTSAEAAAAGDLVVLAVSLARMADLPAASLVGKVVLDTSNYDPQRDGDFAELDDGSTTTSELVQRRLPQAHVVRAFSTIFYRHLAVLGRPAGAADRAALPIAGDDPAAKRAATAFLDAIGYDVVDAGDLAEGWRFRRDQPAFALPYATDGDNDRPYAPSVTEIEKLLAQADPGLR